MDLEVIEFKASDYKREWTEKGYGGRYYMVERSERPDGQSRVYVNIKDESFWDNFAERTSRPHALWRPLVLETLRAYGIQHTGIRWSQKAGCKMCPCSPGFIIQGHPRPACDYWLTISTDITTTDPALALWRKAQIIADPTMPIGSDEQKAAARKLLNEMVA